MKKSLVCVAALLCLTLNSWATAELVPRKHFIDIKWGYWAKGPIETLAGLGIIDGYPDGTYRPDQTVNRAELTAILVRARLGKLSARGFRSFTDVRSHHWAAPYIDKAIELEWVKGFPNGSFQPNRLITRAEGIGLIGRFDNWDHYELVEKPYKDIPLNFWAAGAIATAKSKGLLTYLVQQEFRPRAPLTRAELAELLSRTAFLASLVNAH
jgi:hypothetical protein